MKKRNIILISVLVLIAAGALYGYKEYNRRNKDLAAVTPDLRIQAADLIKKFETDEAAANKAFLTNKIFVIAAGGRIKDVVKDERGYYTIILGDTLSMSSVRCAVDSVHTKDAVNIKRGDTITIQGAITGFNRDDLLGSDVILNRCAIMKE